MRTLASGLAPQLALACALGCAGEPPEVEPRAARIIATQQPAMGMDRPPRIALWLRNTDGTLRPLGIEAVDHVVFRNGAAVVDVDGALRLLSMPGPSTKTLAQVSGAPPVVGPEGALFYGARYATRVELHRLSTDGNDEVLARVRGTVSLVAPQEDGALVFVLAPPGGVAGVWYVHGGRAQCLTACDGERDAPPIPGTAAAITVSEGQVSWLGYDGQRYSVAWDPDKTATPRSEDAEPSTGQAQAAGGSVSR